MNLISADAKLWASELDTTRLVNDLACLAENIRYYDAEHRAALLLEAAKRLRQAG